MLINFLKSNSLFILNCYLIKSLFEINGVILFMSNPKELVVSDSNVARIAKALASETRWKILKLLRIEKMDVSKIAEKLNQTEANISAQIKILEKAALIITNYEPGVHGVKKVCVPAFEKLVINFI